MKKYKNLAGNSGVSYFEIGKDYIKIRFATGGVYTYSYQKAGKAHVENMKTLAVRGAGLSTYISRNTSALYD